jgi:hypothetical protein
LKKIQSLFYVIAIAMILISFTLVGNIANADSTNKLMISGFTFDDEVIAAEESFQFTIHVLEVEVDDQSGAIGKSVPVNDANIQVTFMKNNIKKEINLDQGEDGNYVGDITLPIEGEWNLVAIAQPNKGQVETDNTDNVFTTTFTVDEAQTNSSFFWKVILIIGSVLVLIWTLKRLEPKLKQAQKKKRRV